MTIAADVANVNTALGVLEATVEAMNHPETGKADITDLNALANTVAGMQARVHGIHTHRLPTQLA